MQIPHIEFYSPSDRDGINRYRRQDKSDYTGCYTFQTEWNDKKK